MVKLTLFQSPLIIPSTMRRLILVTTAFALFGCSNTKPIFPESINLTEKQQAAYKAYQAKVDFKGFAVSPNEFYSITTNKNKDINIVQSVLSNCQKKASMPCRILSINNDDYSHKYADFNKQSAKAISSMYIRSDNYRLIEDQNWWMPSPSLPRTLEEGVHFPTPMHIDGIKTISTPDLVAAIKADNMLVIDAIGFSSSRGPSLPNAFAFDWIGIEYGNESKEHTVDELALTNLDTIMRSIAPEKSHAIAVYCSSPECWLSVNAALRLKALGYVNVHWYRGGLAAWHTAGLPTVDAVPFATIWGRP